MATPVVLPRLGNTVESCLIVKWIKNIGDLVKTGEAICEIETDKSVMEVECPTDGTLLEQFFVVDSDVPVMTNIAAIGTPGEDISALRPTITETKEEEIKANQLKTKSVSSEPSQTTTSVLSSIQTGISPRAKNLAVSHGFDPTTLIGSGPQGRVLERDVKTALQSVPHLSKAAKQEMLTGKFSTPTQGSGIGGMVLKSDLATSATKASSSALSLGAKKEVAVKGIRKVIAERMRTSLSTTAQLTLHCYAKATALQGFRQYIKAESTAQNLPDITITDMLIYALSRVIIRHPQLNAHFLGDKIIQYNNVNLGLAVDTERGLMVPVIKAVQDLPLANISLTVKALAKECQAGNINPDLLQGGTFTLTNLGATGIDYFTPVLNAPEVAILGVGGICPRPFVIDGKIEFIPSISFSLTIDHQAVDGAPAARFLKDLVATVEDPNFLFSSNN